MPLDRFDDRTYLGQYGRLAWEPVPTSSRRFPGRAPASWQMRLTMYGCEMVCPQPILERAVRVRTRQIGLVDEQLARNRVHRRQHELVGDPALAQLALDSSGDGSRRNHA